MDIVGLQSYKMKKEAGAQVILTINVNVFIVSEAPITIIS